MTFFVCWSESGRGRDVEAKQGHEGGKVRVKWERRKEMGNEEK